MKKSKNSSSIDIAKKMFKLKPVLLISFLLGISVFFLLGYYIGRTPVMSEELSEKTIQKEFLDDLRLAGLFRPLPLEVNDIVATIVKIEKNSILIQPKENETINPLGTTFPDGLSITIDSNTKLLLAQEKDQKLFTEEYNAFVEERRKLIQKGESSRDIKMPEPYIYKEIAQKDFNLQDTIRVITKKNFLNNDKYFTAERFILMNDVPNFY